MALKTRNKRLAEFSTSSMSDIVFLLLIFFMLTSTLVSPYGLNVNFPNSDSRIVNQSANRIGVDIDQQLNYFINNEPVNVTLLESAMIAKLEAYDQATVELRADQNTPIQYVVNVYNAINHINLDYQKQYKVVLITQHEDY